MRRDDLDWKTSPGNPEELIGKRVIVVGGTGGIGRAIAQQMAANGANVTVVGRKSRDNGIECIQADLSSMKRATEVGDQLGETRFDICVLTTGIFAGKSRKETSEGIELDLAVSYLCRFAIVKRLMAQLEPTTENSQVKPRVFIMGFPGANIRGDVHDLNSTKSYRLITAHGNTIIGNEALVLHCSENYANASFYGLNPGFIKSSIRTRVTGSGLLNKVTEFIIGVTCPSAESYAKRFLPLVTSRAIEQHSGAMFNRHFDAIHPSKLLQDKSVVDRIMRASADLYDSARSTA